MKLTGESLIAADRATVWAALSDPAVRARCVGAGAGDGAEARIAPGRPAFTGGVAMTEAQAPDRCVLVSADEHGSAEISLADAEIAGAAGTRLSYAVSAPTDDDAQARSAAFFARLKAEAERAQAPAAASRAIRPDIHHEVTDATDLHNTKVASGLTPMVWGGILVLAVLAVLVWQLSS